MSPVPMVEETAAAPLSRDVVRVAGEDAPSYLQGQLSQDVEGMSVGAAAWSFLLEPQGHLEALLRVVRTADDTFLLVVDRGLGQPVLDRLDRFRLRVRAELELADLAVWAVRGGPAPSGGDWASFEAGDGREGADLIGPPGDQPRGVPCVGEEWYDAVRIEAGIPVIGRDVMRGAIPAETGLVDRAASFTKGCYTGQELVARIDSRGGRAPRMLVGLESADGPLEPGGAVVVDGQEVGVVGSVAGSPVREPAIGLASVKRGVELPTAAHVGAGETIARLAPLPLVT